MKLLVKLKAVVKNERMVSARIDKGYLKFMDFYKAFNVFHSIAYQQLLGIENMRLVPSPIVAEKISIFLNTPIQVLWPERNKYIVKKLKTINKEREMVVDAERLISGSNHVGKLEFEKNDLREHIEKALNNVDSRARRIVSLRFMEGKTLEECGEILNCTRERIRQIEMRTLRVLRRPEISKPLKEILQPWSVDK